jgi:mRNA-degrading endonuclease RelE of RelBE toxin-antitoxin system
MKVRVEIAPRVEEFVKALAPEPRKRLTQGIKALARNQGDTKMLEGRLESYSRLRLGGYRVIFARRSEQGEGIIDCVFAERRSVVYEIFEKLLAEQIGEGSSRK